MDAKITKRMEIAFWDLFTYKLSDKPWVRKGVRLAYQLLPKEDLRESLLILSIIAVTGFSSGMLLYLVVANWI